MDEVDIWLVLALWKVTFLKSPMDQSQTECTSCTHWTTGLFSSLELLNDLVTERHIHIINGHIGIRHMTNDLKSTTHQSGCWHHLCRCATIAEINHLNNSWCNMLCVFIWAGFILFSITICFTYFRDCQTLLLC